MNKDIAREGYYLGPPVPPHTDVRHKQDSRASEEGDVCQVKQGNLPVLLQHVEGRRM
jgi:hypothetical protein